MIDPKILGENIRKYRKAAAMTQSQLAEKVSVTTQAVSKWENGSIPDALLLYDIANVLNVSIDSLYGISDEMKTDPLESLAAKICSLPKNERMFHIVIYALRLSAAVSGYSSFGEVYQHLFDDAIRLDDEHRLLQISADDGFTVGSFDRFGNYLFMANKKEDDYSGRVLSAAEYTSFFEILSDETAVRILLFLLHKDDESYILTSAIASHLDIPEEESEAMLRKLADRNLVRSRKVENENGEMYGWFLSHNAFILAILIIAKDLINNKDYLSYLKLTGDDFRYLKN